MALFTWYSKQGRVAFVSILNFASENVEREAKLFMNDLTRQKARKRICKDVNNLAKNRFKNFQMEVKLQIFKAKPSKNTKYRN